MHPYHPYSKTRTVVIILAVLILIPAAAVEVRLAHAQSKAASGSAVSNDELIAQFRRVEVASVSDALEQITGKRMYMSHRMQPIFAAKFAGYARTVQLKKDEGNKDPEALTGMLGAVIDGGVRDVAYLRKIGFPVFATGIVPSTSVHHYRFAGAQIPVLCNGVSVTPGDIIVADSDGVAVVPQAQAQAVLTMAQQMDYKEHSMYAVIEQLKSIVQAVKKFGRL